MNQRAEVSTGIVVSVLSLFAIGLAIFAPAVYTYGTNWMEAGSTSLLDAGITAGVAVYLLIMVVAAVGIGVGAYLRSRHLSLPGMSLLWGSAVVLFAGALLTLPGNDTPVVPSVLHTGSPDSAGIGVYLVLPGLAALVTALIETVAHATPHRPAALRSH
jgi:hypothetical protein